LYSAIQRSRLYEWIMVTPPYVMTETDNTSRMLILLLEQERLEPDLRSWLSSHGYVTWKANDVSHALEELTDFTVRRRPDVVLLEVAGLAQHYDDLWSTFRRSAGRGQVAMCAYTGRRPSNSQRHYFASNLDDLKSMISREMRPPSRDDA
jgi:hypothetical protein